MLCAVATTKILAFSPIEAACWVDEPRSGTTAASQVISPYECCLPLPGLVPTNPMSHHGQTCADCKVTLSSCISYSVGAVSGQGHNKQDLTLCKKNLAISLPRSPGRHVIGDLQRLGPESTERRNCGDCTCYSQGWHSSHARTSQVAVKILQNGLS